MVRQQGCRIPLQMHSSVEAEIAEILNNGLIRRVDKINHEVFFQRIVITVKIASDVRSQNNAIRRDKYQMPNLDSLMEQVAELLNSAEEVKVLFSSLDMLYAHGQTEPHPETAKLGDFHIKREKATGTYAFNTGYYGLITMPPEFQ